MLLLFLDTETTELTPLKGQVIEIAGVLMKLDKSTLKLSPFSQFEALVKPRHTVDEKIFRLTGINPEELSVAENLMHIQDDWADWLEPHLDRIIGIVGHSIDFDLSFLKSEGWLLPDTKIIDTLDLSKVLLPHKIAVNLEYLLDNLELETDVAKIFPIDEGIKKSHRALYDTQVCTVLFQRFLQNLQSWHFDQDFYELLNNTILPLDLQFYGKHLEEFTVKTYSEKVKKYDNINLNGDIIENNLIVRFNNLLASRNPELKPLITESLKTFPEELFPVTGPFYTGNYLKNNNENINLKVHLHTPIERSFVTTFLEFLEEEIYDDNQANNQKKIINQFESIIWQIRNLSEQEFNLGNFLLELEIYTKMNDKTKDEFARAAFNFLAIYDFFLLTLQQWLEKNEYYYNPRDMLPEETEIRIRFSEMISRLNALSQIEITEKTPFLKTLSKKITNSLTKWKQMSIEGDKRYSFRIFNHNLIICETRQHFDLKTHFENLITKNPNLEIDTYLQPGDFTELLELLNLHQLFLEKDIEIKYLTENDQIIGESLREEGLEYFLSDKIELAKKENKPVLVLAPTNPVMKNIQRTLINSFPVDSYLALGEDGSLTKIISKLHKGFIGVCVVKLNDFNYLGTFQDLEFSEIWILDKPFLYLHRYWQYLSNKTRNPEQFIEDLRRLHQKSQIAMVAGKSGHRVNLLKSFKM